jgi:hypothetical protein
MSKIKIKLSGEDCGLITQLIQDTTGVQIIHKEITAMVQDLMLEVLEKTHGRSLWTDKKNTISLTPPQARAFTMHFAYVDLSATPYEQNLVRQMIAQIAKELANRNKKPVGYSLLKY